MGGVVSPFFMKEQIRAFVLKQTFNYRGTHFKIVQLHDSVSRSRNYDGYTVLVCHIQILSNLPKHADVDVLCNDIEYYLQQFFADYLGMSSLLVYAYADENKFEHKKSKYVDLPPRVSIQEGIQPPTSNDLKIQTYLKRVVHNIPIEFADGESVHDIKFTDVAIQRFNDNLVVLVYIKTSYFGNTYQAHIEQYVVHLLANYFMVGALCCAFSKKTEFNAAHRLIISRKIKVHVDAHEISNYLETHSEYGDDIYEKYFGGDYYDDWEGGDESHWPHWLNDFNKINEARVRKYVKHVLGLSDKEIEEQGGLPDVITEYSDDLNELTSMIDSTVDDGVRHDWAKHVQDKTLEALSYYGKVKNSWGEGIDITIDLEKLGVDGEDFVVYGLACEFEPDCFFTELLNNDVIYRPMAKIDSYYTPTCDRDEFNDMFAERVNELEGVE
jgi:hypothetical protein